MANGVSCMVPKSLVEHIYLAIYDAIDRLGPGAGTKHLFYCEQELFLMYPELKELTQPRR